MKFYIKFEISDGNNPIDERYDRIIKRLTALYKSSIITEDCYLNLVHDLNIMREIEKRGE